MPTPTVEQYVKTIFRLSQDAGRTVVQMKPLADAMRVTPGTATAMAKQLSSRDLISYTPRRGVQLTEKGKKLALGIIRRHRLIETFLEKVLGYDWSEVHADAEELEHAVSDRFVERINALLGNPENDPHGEPIPGIDGVLPVRQYSLLVDVPQGSVVRIQQLSNHDGDFLQAMKNAEIVPGKEYVLISNDTSMGTIILGSNTRRNSRTRTIGYSVASQILVLRIPY